MGKPHIKLKNKPRFELIKFQSYKINNDAVDYCVDITEKVANGEITSLGIIGVYADGSIMTCYAPENSKQFWPLLGALERLKFRMMKDLE